MQISLVGAGYWGSKLQKELETIPNVDDVEIIDIKDGKNLTDIQYENVVLATPAWDHYEQTLELLAQGKNLYVEKPLALTMQECIDIKNNIKEHQTLMVGHIFLYNDRVKKIKELLPKLGHIQHIEMNRLNWGRFQSKISTLHSLAPHDVSIIHYWLGTHEFKDVKHSGHKFSKYVQNDRDEFEFTCNSVPIKFNLSWYYPEKIRTTAIIGTNGTLFWNEEAKTIKITTDIWKNDRMNYEPTVETIHIESNSLRNELIEFVECVSEGRTPTSDVENAIDVAENLDLLLKSL
jgi:predicted dehydrogenase|tara:strand:+ start:2105 stop:2977 length:873 start_codon:yes stop_codon:yes gene_type:complete